MFDFRQPVWRPSIDIPFHDEFNADGNNEILVTLGAGVQIAGLNHSSSSRQPVQKSPVSPSGLTAAQCIYCRVIRLLMRVLLNHARRRKTTTAMR